tara:strand:+ start:66427 stop:68103 length:1677 start_codon:yes stop_codon:yes gene_type:complete
MSNRKINYNRPVPSSEQVKDRQSFDDIISQVTVNPTPFFKSIGFWGAIGSSVIALTLLTYQFINSTKKKNAYEATSTLAVNSPELPEDTKCLTPIHEENDLKFEVFEIDPSEDNMVFVEGGAIIEIPANSFDLKNDNRKLQIEARVFRTKADAFVAGVPMNYGDQKAFESAGMIEIRGSQNGDKVDFAEGKSIKVTLGLHKSPDDFNFYSLNDESGKWNTYPAKYRVKSQTEKADISEIKSKIIETEMEIETIQNNLEMIRKPEKSDFHLAENDNRVFELKFNKHEFPELKSFERLQFEAKCSSIKYREILEKTWSGVELVQLSKGKYEAQFSNQRGDKTSVSVVPVVTGEAAEVAFENYKSAVAKVKDQKEREEEKLKTLEEENKLRKKRIQGIVEDQSTRESVYWENRAANITAEMKAKKAMLNELYNASAEFTANRWGVFNSDKPVKYPGAPVSPYTYAANDQIIDANMVFVFDLKKDVRYTFGHADHPIREVAMNNNETVIIVQDRQGNMGYARVDGSKDEAVNGQINLTPIDTKEADIDFFKTILDEKERVRA